MERKLGFLLVVGGLAWSCVTPAEVDEEGTDNDQDAVDSGGTGGTGGTVASGDTRGSGGTVAETTTTAWEASGGTGATTDGATGTPGGSTTGEQTSGGDGGDDGVDSEDICPFDGDLEYDPDAAYPFCEGNELFLFPGQTGEGDPVENRCREQVPGSRVDMGIFTWPSEDGSPDGELLTYCLCQDNCESNADCPAGDTGNASAVCMTRDTLGHCFLSCDNGETCPDGMTCTQGHDFEQRICMWGTRGAGCDPSEWPPVTN